MRAKVQNYRNKPDESLKVYQSQRCINKLTTKTNVSYKTDFNFWRKARHFRERDVDD